MLLRTNCEWYCIVQQHTSAFSEPIRLQVQVGVEKELAEAFVEKFRKSPLDVIGGTALTEGRKMGPIEVETAEVKVQKLGYAVSGMNSHHFMGYCTMNECFSIPGYVHSQACFTSC